MFYAANIEKLPAEGLIDLKGPDGDVIPAIEALGCKSPTIGRACRGGVLEVFHPAPGHWLVRAPRDQEGPLLTKFQSCPGAERMLCVAVSDGLVFFRLTGQDARHLLAIASPLDADRVAFLDDGATYTEAFGQRALLVRRPDGFELGFDVSLQALVADWFSRITGQTTHA
ncbi:MAG: hypothetical protein V4731_02870 [Pseudomonadota bacterium]